MKLVFPPSRKPVKRYTGVSILYSKQFLDFFFVNACANYAESSDYAGSATADVNLAGYVIKVKPLTAGTFNDTLGAKNHAEVRAFVKRFENRFYLFPCKFLGGFCTNRGEYVVSMVMVVVVATTVTMLIVVMVVMLVVVASTVTMLVVVVVVMLVLVASTIAMLVVVVVMMLMLVASAITMLVVVVVMLVLVASAITMLVVVVVVMVVLVMLCLELLDCILEGVAVLHSSENVLTVKAIPGGSDDYGRLVVLTKQGYALSNLLVLGGLCVREDYCRCVLNLVIVELAKVLHIHLALINIGNGCEAVKLCANSCVFNRFDNVGKLTNTRGLDNYSVGVVIFQHLNERLGKIANERAADAARVHLGDVDASISEEAAVNADFAKLVLDKNELFTSVRFLNKLLNQSGLTCSEEARKYIYFGHFICSFGQYFYKYYFTTNIYKSQGKMIGKRKSGECDALR